MSRKSLTIAVLSHNEAHQIEACLRSASFADQLLVVDSGSTDGTTAIARNLGAEVHDFPDWQGFAVQRNRQLSLAQSNWILFLDADEEISKELQLEILKCVDEDQDVVYEAAWLQVAFGRQLKYMRRGHGIPRLFPRRLLVEYVGVVHEYAELNKPGIPRKPLRSLLIHNSRRSIHQSLLKLAQYSQLGAVKRARLGKRGGLFRGTASALSSFVRTYFFHRGFMCGSAGFLHCFFVALESFFRYVALKYDADYLESVVKR